MTGDSPEQYHFYETVFNFNEKHSRLPTVPELTELLKVSPYVIRMRAAEGEIELPKAKRGRKPGKPYRNR